MRRALAFASSLVIVGCAGARSLPGDAGADASGGCASGSLTFVMRSAAGEAFCLGAPDSCSGDWLSIADPAGHTLSLDAPCTTRCSDCVMVACPVLCQMPSSMPDGGAQRVWDGSNYAAATCGAGTSCVSPTCAAPGTYTATMCGYRDQADAGEPYCAAEPGATCRTTTFAWPPAPGVATIETTIGDATSCCPASWQLYSCTYGDGGDGSACHNPALGCASSLTCGMGCDPIVTGRCQGG